MPLSDRTEIADELRDLLNWVAVFEEEYDLPDEVVRELRNRVERVSEAVQAMGVA